MCETVTHGFGDTSSPPATEGLPTAFIVFSQFHGNFESKFFHVSPVILFCTNPVNNNLAEKLPE